MTNTLGFAVGQAPFKSARHCRQRSWPESILVIVLVSMPSVSQHWHVAVFSAVAGGLRNRTVCFLLEEISSQSASIVCLAKSAWPGCGAVLFWVVSIMLSVINSAKVISHSGVSYGGKVWAVNQNIGYNPPKCVWCAGWFVWSYKELFLSVLLCHLCESILPKQISLHCQIPHHQLQIDLKLFIFHHQLITLCT